MHNRTDVYTNSGLVNAKKNGFLALANQAGIVQCEVNLCFFSQPDLPQQQTNTDTYTVHSPSRSASRIEAGLLFEGRYREKRTTGKVSITKSRRTDGNKNLADLRVTDSANHQKRNTKCDDPISHPAG
jgi:hypothetical protein